MKIMFQSIQYHIEQLAAEVAALKMAYDSEMRPVPGHPGVFATRDGRIWRSELPGRKWKAGFLPQYETNQHKPERYRYLCADVPVDYRDKACMTQVHTLVALAWCVKPSDEHREVHHIDKDHRNNHADNLVWMTRAEHLAAHREEWVI